MMTTDNYIIFGVGAYVSVLDDVQFLRRGWHHRDKIKTPNGVHWLTIPVLKRGKYDQL